MRRGLALILVVGVLGVLAVLGSAFAVLSRLERRAAQQGILGTQALLLARSGLEDALARLENGQDPDAAANRYGGEDWDLSGGALSATESAQEAYRPGSPDRESCPVRHAMRPSFFERLSSGEPVSVSVDGRLRGVSGRLASGAYALRIQAGGFHVNGGDPASDATPGSYNATLRRMLAILAQAIGPPVEEADGWALIDERPRTTRGWESFEQVRDRALGGNQIKLDALRPYLVLDAWVDRKVLRPTAKATMEGVFPKAWTEIVLGRSDAQPGFTDGRTSVIPSFESRAPVPLSWARSHRPAALALMTGLKGLWLWDQWASPDNPILGVTRNRIGQIFSVKISPAEAALLADQLVAWPGDLDRWPRFSEFCDSVTGLTGTSDLVQAKRDLLKANFNPNSDLNKFNPDRPLWKTVDKADLLAYSTELCLFPSSGWRIEAVGRVLSQSGRTLASRSLGVRRNVSAFRMTTQKELVCENLGRLDVAGDETLVRLPGQAGVPFLGASQGLSPTWGHRLNQPGLGTSGASLQTYPEPCVDDQTGGGLSMSPADYDGCLQLATVETRNDDCYGVATDTRDMKLLAGFTSGWDLDLADAYPADPDGRKVFPDSLQATTAGLRSGLLDAAKPNTLHPDGGYSERNRIPGYLDRGNAHPLHGLISFWFKPNHNFTRSVNGKRNLILLDRTNYRENPQLFVIAHAFGNTNLPGFRLGGMFEISHQASDTGNEHAYLTRRAKGPHRWTLVTFYWDFEAQTVAEAGETVADNGADIKDRQIDQAYFGQPGINWTMATDLTEDAPELGTAGSVRPHKMFLGWRGCTPNLTAFSLYTGVGCEATLDEVAIYDFGSLGAGEGIATQAFAHNRFLEGRYYRGSAYTDLTAAPANDQAPSWFSGPIRLPEGSVLRRVLWTWLLPATAWNWWGDDEDPGVRKITLPNDYPEIELARTDASDYLDSEARSRSTRSAGFNVKRQDWRTDLPVREAFRAHAVFRRPVPLAADMPLIDSPVLDDLTFVYDTPEGPRLLDFRIGE